MTDDRLPAALEAGAIRRQVESAGGHAVVVHRGDPDRGSLLLLVAHRGVLHALLERVLQADGNYRWASRDASDGNGTELNDSAAKRVKFDPDLWLIELDVADPQRFIAELTGRG